ncbi:hypothetical protein [Tsukamurella tyrosinosolvens]|uniref:hypothetical protein n=1 Tax=Tsukamurella tyrosinosolvens TaxID=57704 RepID=UPI003462C615
MKPKFEDVEREIRRLAHEHPDRTGPGLYESNGEPCCIFGHAFYSLGVPLSMLDKWDAEWDTDATTPTDFTGVDDECWAKRWMRRIQANNDYGDTFLQSVVEADDWLIRHG